MKDIFFLRTAKTGSSSLSHWCQLYQTYITNNMVPLDKGDNAGLKEKLAEKKYYTFTIVRNPFTRAISCWKQAICICWIHKDVPFKDYLEIPFHKILDPHYKTHNIPIADYLGEYLKQVDKVVKLESIQEDMDQICDELNLEKTKICHDRLGKYDKEEEYQVYNDSSIVDKIKELYAIDFETFNYSKDPDKIISS